MSIGYKRYLLKAENGYQQRKKNGNNVNVNDFYDDYKENRGFMRSHSELSTHKANHSKILFKKAIEN